MAEFYIVMLAASDLSEIRGSGPAYSRYFKQIAKAVVLPRP